MHIDRPTSELYFGLSYTFCKVRVYKDQELFIRKVLEIHGVEFFTPDKNGNWQEIDTRVLSNLITEALPKMFAQIGLTGQIAQMAWKTIGIEPMRVR